MRAISRRLTWALAPALAVAVVSAEGANDHTGKASTTSTKSAAASSASRTAPGAPRPAGAGGSRVAGAAFGSRSTSVLGAAWHADSTPIKDANLRLRNVVTGKIEAVTKGNDVGQFVFEHVEGGTYIVELVNEAGRIQTVGHVFTIAPGETVATFVRLGSKTPWTTAFFNNTASSVAATAATEGITAITPVSLCISPPCH
jgi:hypothetical protein